MLHLHSIPVPQAWADRVPSAPRPSSAPHAGLRGAWHCSAFHTTSITRSPFPTGGQIYLRQFKINPGLAFVSSALPCVIMLSAWLSSEVCFPQEPVSKRSQRRMLTEGAEKQEAAILLQPPSPSVQR